MSSETSENIYFVLFSVGLQYDTISKDLESKVYYEGLHLGPVGFEFIVFPNIYTTMSYDDLVVSTHLQL